MIGADDPATGNSYFHKSSPFFEFKILINLSGVPVAIEMSPAVLIIPPKFISP